MPPRKTPKNTSKARRKKSMMRLPSSLKQLMHSSIILFLVFVVVLMDLMSLWKSNDNESLFLFIFIALLTYTQNQNMIVVLGVPLIIVNVLRMMKKSLNYEGFDDEKVNPYKLQEFARDYFRNNKEYEETSEEYGIVNEEENEEENEYILYEIVNKFMEGPFMEDEEDEDNNASVMTLISYISYIDGISKEDVSDFDEEQKSQYDYVKKMIKKFKSDKKKKDDKKKKKEEEVSLEDITMEDDEIQIEGEEEEEENFDNKKKDKKKDLADITKSLQNISNMLGSSS